MSTPRYVETLERRGHRFIAPVEFLEDASATSVITSGAASPGRIVYAGRAIPLHEGMNLIGRDSSAAIFIDSSKVSRRHALIAIGPAGVTLSDLGSKNGTFVNALPVHSPMVLSDGDEIVIGSARLVFRS